MARTPNYSQQRADRNRAKQAKKDAKLRKREESVARRREAERDEAPSTSPPPSTRDDTPQP